MHFPGGAISHFGTSHNGTISDNWIMWNRAVDEGGGIIVASETLSAASVVEGNIPANAGDVTISDNTIQGCLSGDDGGGIRFLNPGLSQYTVVDNIISHNVAMHEGGGVSINDAPFVTFTGNTVVSNIVTGTSLESSTAELYAAGLATHVLGQTVLTKLADGSISYNWTISHPQNFAGNVFWDNRASNGEVIVDGVGVPVELTGLDMSNPSNPSNLWLFDMGVPSGGPLVPLDSDPSSIQTTYCLTSTSTPPFTSPFLCSGSALSSSLPKNVMSTVTWGVDLKVKVVGLVVSRNRKLLCGSLLR